VQLVALEQESIQEIVSKEDVLDFLSGLVPVKQSNVMYTLNGPRENAVRPAVLE